jgi:hypothetical protein
VHEFVGENRVVATVFGAHEDSGIVDGSCSGVVAVEEVDCAEIRAHANTVSGKAEPFGDLADGPVAVLRKCRHSAEIELESANGALLLRSELRGLWRFELECSSG